jgi:tRNA U34 2-thiouridine synthase MnmA/TrmU
VRGEKSGVRKKQQTTSRPPKAVALYSGGLDSTLAILTIQQQGIEVVAVTFLTHFGCDISDRSSCSKNPFAAAEQFGFEVKLCHLSDTFIEIVKNPKYGHGKNMNPCMDCRILMLKEARAFMEMIGAHFIITGEVLGQRPMSQRRDALHVIDREAGLKGYVLRPLSAQLLNPTVPEEQGMVKRERLYRFSGRNRKPQMALAGELGLTDYPAPAGGCLLTEPNYAYRLRELLAYNRNPSYDDLLLLRLGRHFRLSPDCKIIVGRNKSENELLLKLATKTDTCLRVEGFGSPVTLIKGEANRDVIEIAASLCARYSDAKKLPAAVVRIFNSDESFKRDISPADEETLCRYRIEKTREPHLVHTTG